MPTKKGELNINELGKIYEMFADIKHIRMTLDQSIIDYKKLYEQVNGNGKPGLKQDIHDLKVWKKENSDDIEKLIRSNGNQSYLKKGTWELVRWLGSGTIIYGIVNFLK